jgi:hypothetical protein
MVKKISSLLLTFPLVAFVGSLHAGPLITVEHYRWTDSVDPNSRQFGKVHTSPLKFKNVVLWMQVNGSKDLLEELGRNTTGDLPVRVEWYRYTSLGVVGDDTVSLKVGRKSDLQKLSYDVDSNGFFRWRIWSSKNVHTTGWWRADLLYGDNDPVMCSVAGISRPCRFEIEVR